MYIFRVEESDLEEEKPVLHPLVEKRIQELYGTTLVTRILAVFGLVFLLALFSVALVRIFVG